MKEYKIVKCNYISGLERQINILMAKGWKPLGGISVSENYCFQSMVKDNTKHVNTGPR